MQATLLSRLRGSRTSSYPLILARSFALLTLWLVPISTAGVNLGSALFTLCALASPEAWRRMRTMRAGSSASIAALILFVALALSVAYSSAPAREAVDFLLKYRKLLFFPLLFLVFQSDDDTNWAAGAIWGLFATLVLSMVLTYTNAFGWTAFGPMHGAEPVQKPWVFKDHISGGLMMAFLVCMSFALARATRKSALRVLLYGVGTLALINVLFVLKGRTGQVVAIAYMAIYVVVQATRLRQYHGPARWVAVLAGVAVCAALVFFALHGKDSRLGETTQEITQYETQNKNTSMGVRIEFYRRSTELLMERPIAGYGAGSVRTQFERLVSASTGGRAAMAGNPHNEFLLMGVQLGLIGVALFVWLLVTIRRECQRLADPERSIAYGYLFAFVFGCLANSLLLNFTEGNLFVFLIGILIYGARRRVDDRSAAPS